MQDQNAPESSDMVVGGAKKRSPSKWNNYVKSYSKAHPTIKGPTLFKSAAKSYRAGKSPTSRSRSRSPPVKKSPARK
jgi:hypothetical protein